MSEQNSLPSTTNTADADAQQFVTLRTTFETAANTNDLDLLAPYLDPEFSAVTYTDRQFTDFESFKAQWQKTREQLLKGGSYAVKLLPEHRTIVGDISISRGNSENILTTGSRTEHKFNAHWTVVCRKTNGQWKILRAHCSLDPFGNPMLRSTVKGMLVKCSVIAGIIGVVAGFLIRSFIQ